MTEALTTTVGPATSEGLLEAAQDYRRIARAIRWLEAHRHTHPNLDQIAAVMGLSPFHAQRLFTRWAGISPKRFLGLLTLAEARDLLAESGSVLDTAYELGLSGPSRLHDLFTSYDAITPGAFKGRGAGMVLRYGVHPTPYGEAFVLASARGIVRLEFLGEDEDAREALGGARSAWPRAEIVGDRAATGELIRLAFAPLNGEPAPPLVLAGTNFQIQVWSALLRVPPGRVVSYRQIARAIGRPHAARAVGRAVGSNRIGVLVPCHRVIRETGLVGGYHWGVERKRAMLARERAHALAGHDAAMPNEGVPGDELAADAAYSA